MIISEINANWDTARDQDVDPVLWEVRRERLMELSCEGLSFNDIRHWKKAENQLSKMPMGAWVKKSDYGNPAAIKVAQYKPDGTIDTSAGLTEGYVYIFTMIGVNGWQPHYYLYPLPLNDLALYENLKQNNGYQTEAKD